MVDYYWAHHSTYRGIEIVVLMPGSLAYGAMLGGYLRTATELSDIRARIDDYLGPEEPPEEPPEEEPGKVFIETYRGVDIYFEDAVHRYWFEFEGVPYGPATLSEAHTWIDTLLEPTPEPEEYWEYHSTYRGILIYIWMPSGAYYQSIFGGETHNTTSLSTLQAEIDAFLEPETYVVGVAMYDGATDAYVIGALIIDGVRYTGEQFKVLGQMEGGVHTFNVEPPTGYTFVEWQITEYGGDPIGTSTARPLSVNIDRHIWIWAEVAKAPAPTYVVGVGMYDEGTDEYVKGTITVDGVNYPNVSTKTSMLEEGNHTFNVTPPTGYEFVKWTVHEYTTGAPLIRTSTTRPLSQNIDRDIWIWAVLRLILVDIPTTLIISAPASVEPNAAFTISGILYERNTGIPIPNQSVALSYNGRSLGSAGTGIDGDYFKRVSIPSAGVYTLRAAFAGSSTLGASEASSKMNTTGISGILPLAVIGGLALALMKKKKKP